MSKLAVLPTGRRFLLCATVALGGLGLAGNAAAATGTGAASKAGTAGSIAVADDGSATDELIVCADATIEPMLLTDLAESDVAIEATVDAVAQSLPVTVEPTDDLVIDDGFLIDDGCMGPIDPATSNAEQDALAAYLAAHGIAYEIVEDGDYHWVEIDVEDEASLNALDDFYWEQSPLPQEVIDQINADAESMAAFLRDHGIEVTVTTDRHGLKTADFDWEATGVEDALSDYYWQQYPLDQATIDQINAEAEDLAGFLRDRGFEVTVTTDRHGLKSAEWDWENADIQAALTEYWGDQFVAVEMAPGDAPAATESVRA